MGCVGSTPAADEGEERTSAYLNEKGVKERRTKKFDKPVWSAPVPMSKGELQRKREEFWDTQPHYGGSREMWDALKAAAEADIGTARLIVESAGIIVAAADMTICYDERGAKYELPTYVLSDPTNLVVE